jgi:hypothetical protein
MALQRVPIDVARAALVVLFDPIIKGDTPRPIELFAAPVFAVQRIHADKPDGVSGAVRPFELPTLWGDGIATTWTKGVTCASRVAIGESNLKLNLLLVVEERDEQVFTSVEMLFQCRVLRGEFL